MTPHQSESETGSDPHDIAVRYGTRWGVFGLVLMPALAIVGGIGVALASGALALSLVAQSGTLDLATTGLTGQGFGVVVPSVPVGGGAVTPSARIGVGAARINGLCLAQRFDVLGKPFTALITGGDADPSTFEIGVDGLVLDVADVHGVIRAGGELQVNKSGAEVRPAPGIDLAGPGNRFGLQAGTVTLANIQATVRDVVIPNLLSLPNFGIRVLAGTQRCPAPGGANTGSP